MTLLLHVCIDVVYTEAIFRLFKFLYKEWASGSPLVGGCQYLVTLDSNKILADPFS